MSTIKDLSAYVDRLEAKAIAKPSKATALEAKLDAKIASLIAKGKTVQIDGATVTSYNLNTGSSGSGSSSGGSTTTDASYRLTQLINSVTGGAGNDTIDGTLDGGQATWQTADVINGGNGTDTLYILGAPATVDLVNTTNVEKFYIGATAAGATIDMSRTAGETHVGSYLATQNMTFNNIGSLAVVVSDTGSAGGTTSFNWSSSLTGGNADAVSVVLNGTTQTVSIDPTANGIETVNLQNTGATSTLAGLTLGGAVTTLNLTGDKLLDIDATNLAATVATINASGSTGGVRVQQDRAMSNNFTGSSGADQFWFNDAAANLTTADTINGGDGTDTFIITTAIGANTATNVTNFEVLGVDMDVAAINQDMDNFNVTTITVVDGDAAGANGLTITDAKANTTVNIDQTTGAVAATIKTNTASDAITFNLGGTAGGATVASLDPATSYETIQLNSIGTAANVVTAFGTAFTNMTIGGTTALTLTTTATGGTGVIDASSLLASLTVSDANLAAQTLTLTAYNDTVSQITANQTINAGAGDDTITASLAASSVINLQDGNDTFTQSSSAIAGHTVNGGDGIDVLTLGTGVSTIDVASTAVSVANADIITNFVSNRSDYDANQTLVNGTTASGVSSVLATVGSTISSELSTALTSNANATVIVTQTNLGGDASTALTSLAGATAANFAARAATFEAALVAALGTLSDLDNNLNASDKVLVTFDNGTHSVLVYVTNTSASGNTLTVDEIAVVGVLNGTAALIAADII